MISLREVMLITLYLQALTMVGLGVYFALTGQTRLGVAQFLLAAVTIIIYSGGL